MMLVHEPSSQSEVCVSRVGRHFGDCIVHGRTGRWPWKASSVDRHCALSTRLLTFMSFFFYLILYHIIHWSTTVLVTSWSKELISIKVCRDEVRDVRASKCCCHNIRSSINWHPNRFPNALLGQTPCRLFPCARTDHSPSVIIDVVQQLKEVRVHEPISQSELCV